MKRPESEELEQFAERVGEELQEARWSGWAQGKAPELPARPELAESKPVIWWLPVLAAALLILTFLPPLIGVDRASYEVIFADGHEVTYFDGDTFRASPGGYSEVLVADLGSLTLDPGSVLRVDAADSIDGEHLLHLESGALTASIFAAPRIFQLGTPAGLAVDLGCIYRVEVDQDGLTRVEVLSGAVSMEWQGDAVRLESGDAVWAHPEHGLGVATRADADARFLDFLKNAASQAPDSWSEQELLEIHGAIDAADIGAVWSLMMRATGSRRLVLGKILAGWTPLPAGTSLEECVDPSTDAHGRWRALHVW